MPSQPEAVGGHEANAALDFLSALSGAEHPLPPLPAILFRVGLALACGFAVAALHRLTRGGRAGRRDDRALPTTLVMLAVLVAVTTLVIGNSTARAFGIVGALSIVRIVRFRSVVEDTADIAFVIFAVITGMGAGAGYWLLAAVALPVAGGAAAVMSWLERAPAAAARPSGTLTVRLGLGHEPAAVLGGAFAAHLAAHAVTGLTTARQGAAVEVTYAVTLRGPDAAFPLVMALNKLDGVQGVELRQG